MRPLRKIDGKITQALADEINMALCGIYKIQIGSEKPELYNLYQSTLTVPKNFSLRLWLEATDFIDKWNKMELSRSKMAGREPNFVMTMRDDFIAALFTFLSNPAGKGIMWDGGKNVMCILPEQAGGRAIEETQQKDDINARNGGVK